ncbi:amino acid transporter [Cryptococcus neoformans 125.91]|nr:amino acid transporter [Cryptococcus neoformans var. grubii 125.91]
MSVLPCIGVIFQGCLELDPQPPCSIGDGHHVDPLNVAMKAQKNRLQVIPPRAFQEPALCWPGRSFGPGCSSGFRATPFLKRQLGCGNLHLQLRYYRSCGRNRSWFQDLCAYSVPPLKRCRPQDRPRLL